MEQAKFYKDMDIDVYHGHKNILSKSMLGDFADCPARFKYKYIDGNIEEKTKSLRMGNAVHTLALEPELWESGYHILPATYYNADGEQKPFRNDLRSQHVQDQYESAGWIVEKDKAGQNQLIATKRAKVILTQSEYATVEKMANALAANQYACSILQSPGYVESSIFWDEEVENPDTGEIEIVKMRCRPDLIRNDSLLADVKTAQAVKPDLFYKDAHNLHYDLSVAISYRGYKALHGKEPDNYVFVCVESKEPHIVECYDSLTEMDDIIGLTYLDYGQKHLDHLLKQYVACRASNTWPGYQKKIGGMRVPQWAMRKFIEEGF